MHRGGDTRLVEADWYVGEVDVVGRERQDHRIGVVAQQRIEEGEIARHRPEGAGDAARAGQDHIVGPACILAVFGEDGDARGAVDGDGAGGVETIGFACRGDFDLIGRAGGEIGKATCWERLCQYVYI